jgi:hypothetical protein
MLRILKTGTGDAPVLVCDRLCTESQQSAQNVDYN